MQKALIVTPFFRPNIGGCETFAEDLAQALLKKYDLVHVSTIKWKKPIVWEGLSFRKAVRMVFKLASPTFKMVDEYKYDKVYALGLIASCVCCILNIPFYTVMLALYDFKKRNWFTRWILNRAEKVFVEGHAGEEDVINLGVPKHNIIRYQHWCDQSKFHPIDRKREGNLKVLFVGRPIPIKGKHIIQACEKLTEGIDYEYIENVKYEDLPQYYQRADVLVVPSLYNEGFTRVVIEAASCGCIILASNRGALPELVEPYGFAIEPTPGNFKRMLVRWSTSPRFVKLTQDTTFIFAQHNFSAKNAEVFFK